MCCGEFEPWEDELKTLAKPEQRKHRIGRRPFLKGLGAMGLLAALGMDLPGLLTWRAIGQQVVSFKKAACFQSYSECILKERSTELNCEIAWDCCLQEIDPPNILEGDLINPFCNDPDIRRLFARLLDAPDIRAVLEPLEQQLRRGQCLPLRESGPLLMGGLDALSEVRHRLGRQIRDQQASGPLGVEVVAEASQACGSPFSHSVFVSWRIYGGRPPVQARIEITDPAGNIQHMTGTTPEGMVKFELSFPGGGSASVLVTAQDASNSSSSAQSSVSLGACSGS